MVDIRITMLVDATKFHEVHPKVTLAQKPCQHISWIASIGLQTVKNVKGRYKQVTRLSCFMLSFWYAPAITQTD